MGRELYNDDTNLLVLTKGQQPPMGTTPGIDRDRIRAIYIITASAYLQVSPDGGPFTNDIFVEKTDGEGSGLYVYCYCWNAILGIGRT